MMRGTFGNIRIDNKLVDRTGGFTKRMDEKFLYTAAMEYQQEGIPLVILAGQMYGAGSSRTGQPKELNCRE